MNPKWVQMGETKNKMDQNISIMVDFIEKMRQKQLKTTMTSYRQPVNHCGCTPLIQLSIERHTKRVGLRTLPDCKYTPYDNILKVFITEIP